MNENLKLLFLFCISISLVFLNMNLTKLRSEIPSIKATSQAFDCRKISKLNPPGRCQWVIEIKD